MADGQMPAGVERDGGRYRFRCTCGWTSPWDQSAAAIGSALDDHLAGAAAGAGDTHPYPATSGEGRTTGG